MSEANAGGGENDDENTDTMPTASNRPTDVRDELINSLISQNEILTKEVANLTANIDELTKRLTSNHNDSVAEGKGKKLRGPLAARKKATAPCNSQRR